jgi:GAF domain-containing protein
MAALSLPEDVSLPRRSQPMSEKTELGEDLRAEVETLVTSGAPDEEVLYGVVRRVHEAHPSWDWSGIYLLVDDTLERGPATAPADHSRIGIGEGVCGTAVAEDENQLIEDVREIENYLACSIHTRSELVVLIREGGKIVGQFDIDSDTVGAFSAEDERLLDELAGLVAPRVASLAASHQ